MSFNFALILLVLRAGEEDDRRGGERRGERDEQDNKSRGTIKVGSWRDLPQVLSLLEVTTVRQQFGQ